ncbi:cell wall hydrolase [Mesobaculum littorinae]|uniref:Cell wall hydrolase n=2 Tax=Mesobaculum littorinae TaxID=2486419 RepID=A0A438AKI4_9RHOB|nr:cell wall hydrolase [Mesobaculum littorinae]
MPLADDFAAAQKAEKPDAGDIDPVLAALLGPEAPEVRMKRNGDLVRLIGPRGAPPMPEVPEIDYTVAFVADLPEASGGEDWQCLTEALYFEARGETVRGVAAVAEVILNRVESSRFPGSVCAVVRQGTGKKYQCQFSYTCDGHDEAVHERAAWTRVGKIAKLMLDGAPRDLTEGATYYHTAAVRPGWAGRFALTATIGAHLFYSNG